jgi:hypothetical protein
MIGYGMADSMEATAPSMPAPLLRDLLVFVLDRAHISGSRCDPRWAAPSPGKQAAQIQKT